jgi:hypothetical protein
VNPAGQSTEVILRPHRRQRPVRTFRAIGVFFLALGAVAGVYVAVSHTGRSEAPAQISVDVLDLNASGTPTVDPSLDQAVALAQEKAAAAAAEAADKMKQANEAALRTQQAASRSETRTTAGPTQAPYKIPASCGEFTGNRAIGCAVLLESGFGLDQMPCLDKLFTKESGWNPKAKNKSSGAYGVPQALPGNKMAAFGADWQTSVATQVKWGISYIKNRYKTPCAAWAHSQSTGWY